MEVLRDFPANFFDLTITSPPYFKMRTYTNDSREIGKELFLPDFIRNLSEVFQEVKKVTKETGSLWVNIDDSYDHGPMLVPEKLLFRLIEDGWYLVNKVVWYKIDAMSESSKRRFCRKYEMFYWFVKDRSEYYFNQDASRIPVKASTVERLSYKFHDNKGRRVSRMRNMFGDMSHLIDRYLTEGVGCGDLWVTPTNKEKVEHIAPYPEALLSRAVVACCPPDGVILDPFAGSGTTLLTARKLGAICYGIDLNPLAVKEANERIKGEVDQLNLFTRR